MAKYEIQVLVTEDEGGPAKLLDRCTLTADNLSDAADKYAALFTEVMTITVEGLQYQVTRRPDADVHPSNRPGYLLEGPRGAQYVTFRNNPRPYMMYLVNARDWTKSAPKSWLTDKNGTLEVA